MKPRIIVSNDDGITGPGLMPLLRAMKKIGHAIAVVPDKERSAGSHALTIRRPIRMRRIADDLYATDGSPADCMRLGVIEIFKGKVDLAVSGINRGWNIGEDVTYSGTVAAAREAVLFGLPAIAFSQEASSLSYDGAVPFCSKFARLVLKSRLPPGICLNVNFPKVKPGAKPRPVIASLGRHYYLRQVRKKTDAEGPAYWLESEPSKREHPEDSDIALVHAGRITITPLHVDSTDWATLETLRQWPL